MHEYSLPLLGLRVSIPGGDLSSVGTRVQAQAEEAQRHHSNGFQCLVNPPTGLGLPALSLNLVPALFRQNVVTPRTRFEVPQDAAPDRLFGLAEEEMGRGHYIEAGLLLRQAAVLNGDDFIHDVPGRTVIPLQDSHITARWQELSTRLAREREGLPARITQEIQNLRTQTASLRGQPLREAVLRLERLEEAQGLATRVLGLQFPERTGNHARDMRPLAEESATRILTGALNHDDDQSREGVRIANSLVRYQRADELRGAVLETLRRLYPSGSMLAGLLDYSTNNPAVASWVASGPHLYEPSLETMAALPIVRVYRSLSASQNPEERRLAEAIAAVLTPPTPEVLGDIFPVTEIDGQGGLDAMSQRLERVFGSPDLSGFLGRVRQAETEDLSRNPGFENRTAINRGLASLPELEGTLAALGTPAGPVLTPEQRTRYRDQLSARIGTLRGFFSAEVGRIHELERDSAPRTMVRYREGNAWMTDEVPQAGWVGPMEQAAQARLEGIRTELTRLQGMNPADAGSLSLLQSATRATIGWEEAQVRSRLEREVGFVASLPNGGRETAALNQAIAGINPSEPNAAGRVASYRAVLAQVDTAVLSRSVDARIETFRAMVPTLQTADRYNVFGYSFAPGAQAMADRYSQVRTLIQGGNLTEARERFIALEQSQMGPDLQGRYDSARWTNLGVSVGIVIASAFVMRQVNLAAGPTAVRALGALWGARANLALGTIAFRGTHNFLESRLTSNTTALYDDHGTFGQNARRFGLQVTEDLGMFSVLGGSLRGFHRFAEARDWGSVRTALGAFGTELGAIQTWNFGMTTLRNGGDVVQAAGQTFFSGSAWGEQALFLVALRGGNALSLPVFGPMNQIAAEAAESRYRDVFQRAETAVADAQTRWDGFVRNGEGSALDVIRSLRRALEERRALLEIPELQSLRDPQTVQANEQALTFVRAQEADFSSRSSLFGAGNRFGAELVSSNSNSGSVPANHTEAFVAALRADSHVSNVQVGENGLITFDYRGANETSPRQFRFVRGEPLENARTAPAWQNALAGVSPVFALQGHSSGHLGVVDFLMGRFQAHPVLTGIGFGSLAISGAFYYFGTRMAGRNAAARGVSTPAAVADLAPSPVVQAPARTGASRFPIVGSIENFLLPLIGRRGVNIHVQFGAREIELGTTSESRSSLMQDAAADLRRLGVTLPENLNSDSWSVQTPEGHHFNIRFRVRPAVTAEVSPTPVSAAAPQASAQPSWGRFLGFFVGMDIRTRNGDPTGTPREGHVDMNVSLSSGDRGTNLEVSVADPAGLESAMALTEARARQLGLRLTRIPALSPLDRQVALNFRVEDPNGGNMIVGTIRVGNLTRAAQPIPLVTPRSRPRPMVDDVADDTDINDASLVFGSFDPDEITRVMLGSDWVSVGAPVRDTESAGHLLTARPRNGAVVNGFEGNLIGVATRYPELASRLGITVHADGSVTYPDATAMNARLARAGFHFRFRSVQGESSPREAVEGLAQEIPEFPFSRSGGHHLHDVAVHLLGYSALPPRVMTHLRDTARNLIADLREAHSDRERQAVDIRMEEFVANLDNATGMLAQNLLDSHETAVSGNRHYFVYNQLARGFGGRRLRGNPDELMAEGVQQLGRPND